jgi:YigZ family protein
MEKDVYCLCMEEAHGEITEKKSRFIADIIPVKDEEEALKYIEGVRKKFWDARHHCYAYIVGDKGSIQRCSDDGEPSKTAGRPMLDVLLSKNLINVCAVVTRYFGGTLLGTGGLVRAYQSAVIKGLESAEIVKKEEAFRFCIKASYDMYGNFKRMEESLGIFIEDVLYTEEVDMKIIVKKDMEESFLKKLAAESAGSIVPYKKEEIEFVKSKDKIIVVN